MRNHKIFNELEALGVLQEKIRTEGNFRGYRSQLARAAGCQQAYLSQVLAKKVLLTMDHAAGLSDFWGLTEAESDYFLTLVELSRAGTDRLKRKLKARLDKIKQRSQESNSSNQKATVAEVTNMTDQAAVRYYSSWIPSAIHMLLTTVKSATVNEISSKLKVDELVVQKVVMEMTSARILEKYSEHFVLKAKFLHVPDDILYANLHHRNWRERVVQQLQLQQKNNFHYTSVCSLDKEAFLKVREILNQCQKEIETSVINASEKSVACLNVDWFEVIS